MEEIKEQQIKNSISTIKEEQISISTLSQNNVPSINSPECSNLNNKECFCRNCLKV